MEPVTAQDVESAWARYGTGKPLREGFAQWLADNINRNDPANFSQHIMTHCINHFPFNVKLFDGDVRPWNPKEEERVLHG